MTDIDEWVKAAIISIICGLVTYGLLSAIEDYANKQIKPTVYDEEIMNMQTITITYSKAGPNNRSIRRSYILPLDEYQQMKHPADQLQMLVNELHATVERQAREEWK